MNSKTQSILSYLGILWLIAYFLGKDQRDSLSLYHLKQGFGLLLTGVIINAVGYILVSVDTALAFVVNIIGIVFLIFIVLGVLNAANEVRKPLPLIGHLFENQFSFLD